MKLMHVARMPEKAKEERAIIPPQGTPPHYCGNAFLWESSKHITTPLAFVHSPSVSVCRRLRNNAVLLSFFLSSAPFVYTSLHPKIVRTTTKNISCMYIYLVCASFIYCGKAQQHSVTIIGLTDFSDT